MLFNKKYIFFFLGLTFVVGGLACFFYKQSKAPTAIKKDERIQVTASFYPLAFFVEEIGRGRVHVVNLTPTGVEPHDYELTTQDIVHINSSDLLIMNGGGFESWSGKMLKNIDTNKTIIVAVNDGIAVQMTNEKEGSVVDPHTWLDPLLAIQIAEKIKRGLIAVDPINFLHYETNTERLVSRLRELDFEYKNNLKACSGKNIVTAHSAFGYLAFAYGLHQVSIAGLSPDAEPSPRQLGEVVQFVRNNGIKFIFFESLTSPKLSETIAREAGAETLVLNPLEGLSPEEIIRGEDYFTIMRKNLLNLRTALSCNS